MPGAVRLNSRRKSNTWLNQPEVQAIFQAGGPEVFNFLVNALRSSGEPVAVREGAAYLLGQLGDIRAVEVLIGALGEI